MSLQPRTEELFASAAFQEDVALWAGADTQYESAADTLYRAMRARTEENYEDSDIEIDVDLETEWRISLLREDPSFHGGEIQQLFNGREGSDRQRDEARKSVLQRAQSLVDSGLLLWSLSDSLHVPHHTPSSHILPDIELKTQHKEERLLEFNQLIQDNPGEVVTFVHEFMGASSGRVGSGDITIEKGGIIIPTDGRQAYWVSYTDKENPIHESDRFQISARDVANEPLHTIPAAELPNMDAWYRQSTFIIGTPTGGERTLPSEILKPGKYQSENILFYTGLYASVVALGKTAAQAL